MAGSILNCSVTKIINYEFKDPSILEEALTHPQAQRMDAQNQSLNYERLEFVGDSVLGFVISLMLFKMFPHQKEGILTERKMALVRGSTLSKIAKDIGLDKCIILGGPYKCVASDLENALEAVVGAIYIDGGLDPVERFIFRHWRKLALDQLPTPPKSSKNTLQEWAHAQKLPIPEYAILEKTGPNHEPEYTVSVSVKNHGETSASATSKKGAELKAAEKMLKKLGVIDSGDFNSKKVSSQVFVVTEPQNWIVEKKDHVKPGKTISAKEVSTIGPLW
ncbi:unnamed protein product [Bemisia tabaci]|uniref:Uncharacterized protein n=1 Tax=Bemisia tabaci TaxID=7038 RepID=A0A9P0F6Q7_BEMTA|nr:unnamed protein product [Bemisia tabaci]